MEIDIHETEEGNLLIFSEGDVTNTVYLDRKNRFKLMQLLVEQQLEELKNE